MPHETKREWDQEWDQAGWATYSAIMLFGAGLVGIVNGVWAFRYDDTETSLVVAEKNLELWGAIALVGGVLLLATGIGLFRGKVWARWTGITLSVLGLVWNAAWAEVQPTQSLISALIFASVIFGLATTPVDIELKERAPDSSA